MQSPWTRSFCRNETFMWPPSLRKNAFDCVGFPLSPPERFIISALFLSTKFDNHHKHHFMRIFCLCFHLWQRRLAALSVWSLLRNISRSPTRRSNMQRKKKKEKAHRHFWTSSLKFWLWQIFHGGLKYPKCWYFNDAIFFPCCFRVAFLI